MFQPAFFKGMPISTFQPVAVEAPVAIVSVDGPWVMPTVFTK